jgi:hypothetical protein
MALLCDLGWHRPNPIARWNDGYYFSKCLRCGQDLVRTAYGRWQVPEGYKVVWQATAPEGAISREVSITPHEESGAAAKEIETPTAAPVIQPEPEPEPEPDVEDELPIAEVLRSLEPPEPPPVVPPEPVRYRRPSSVPDFMDEDFGRPAPAAPIPAGVETVQRPPAPGRVARLRAWSDERRRVAAEKSAARKAAVAAAPPPPVEEPAETPFGRTAAVTLALFFIVIVSFALLSPRDAPRQGALPPAEPALPAAPAAAPAPARAFVTASLVNCRESPVEQAKTVRKLRRGAELDVLATESGWASVAQSGRQCWVMDRYISAAQPL